MSNNSGLYGAGTPSQTVPGNDTTSLYGASSGNPVPSATGDLVVRGNLAVLGGNITTTAATATLFNTNATNLAIGGAATILSLGASTGTTTVNNSLVVGGNLTVDGTFIAPSADFGNITIAVADDNTISTTTGDLKLNSATSQVNVLGKMFVQDELTVNDGTLKTNSGNVFLFNDPVATQADAFGYATTVGIGADTGNTTINNNLIVNDNLTVQGTTITTKPAAYIQWAENSNRSNRLNFKSTNGTTTGIRIVPPVATGGSATNSVITTNDINNTSFVNISANQSATNPLRIQTGKYTAGVLGPSGTSLAFIDNATTYATVNPAGPTIATDLATKSYVDSHEANTTYTIDASTTTGGANFNLVGSDATTDTIKFAGSAGTTVTRTDANTITISSAVPADPSKLVNGSYQFVLNADGSITTPNSITTSNLGDTLSLYSETAGPIQSRLDLSPTNAILSASGHPISNDSSVDVHVGAVQINTTSGVTNYQWSFNNDGTTAFPSYTFPYADGTFDVATGAGQVLETNGAGGLQWAYASDLVPTYTTAVSAATGGVDVKLEAIQNATISVVGTTTIKGGTNISVTNAGNVITIDGTDLNTTYNIDATSITGGANLNLNGSDSTTDSVAYKGSGATTVTRTDANTITISSTDTNTTYTQDVSSTTGGANVNLVGSDSTTDSVAYKGAGSVTVTATDASTVTISATDTNTTYTYAATSATGGANLTLTGSDSTTNTVKVSSGTGITVADVSATEISVTNTGVTSAVAGTGIGVSSATGAVTFSNTGVLSVTSGGHITATTVSGAVTLGSDATDANTASTIVARDASGNFSAGAVTLAGDIAVNGGDVTTTSAGTATVFNTNATTLNMGGAATTVSIGASTGTTTVNNALVITGKATLADMSRVDGQLYATRNASWTPVPNPLTTLAGNNGIAIGSSNPGSGNGYSPQVQLVYCSGDTTAGTNASAAIVTRGSAGTTASPSAIATNQVAGTWNIDGYATSGWASVIATTGSGAGTTSISPLQVQAYAVSAFTDSAGTVTNAPMGFRVRGFAASTNLSTANRFNFIDLTAATQTYKTTTFNVQPTTSTANYLTLGATTGSINQDTFTLKNNAGTTTYGSFTSAGTTISGAGLSNIVRTTVGTPGVAEQRPSMNIRLSRSDQAAPNNADSTGFRYQLAGSNGTSYNIADMTAQYSTSGDDSWVLQLANGDQTSGTFSGLTVLQSKITSTTIRAGTASGTPGGSSVADKLTIDATKITAAVPVVFPNYTAAALRAITGAIGWQACVSNSASGSNPNGMMAFWDTSNARWSYIHDNSAV